MKYFLFSSKLPYNLVYLLHLAINLWSLLHLFLYSPYRASNRVLSRVTRVTVFHFIKQYLKDNRGKLDYFNLSHNCHVGNLLIRPRKGTAVMWYNHFMDEESGWLGKLDEYSLHGGCDILKGEKWIANNWITAPYKDGAHIPSSWLNFY